MLGIQRALSAYSQLASRSRMPPLGKISPRNPVFACYLQAWGLLELQCGNMAAALLLLERSVRQGRSYLCASAREAQVTGQGIRVRAARML